MDLCNKITPFPTDIAPPVSPVPKYTTPPTPTVLSDSSTVKAITSSLLDIYNIITNIKLYMSNFSYYNQQLLEYAKIDPHQDCDTFRASVYCPFSKYYRYILFKTSATLVTLNRIKNKQTPSPTPPTKNISSDMNYKEPPAAIETTFYPSSDPYVFPTPGSISAPIATGSDQPLHTTTSSYNVCHQYAAKISPTGVHFPNGNLPTYSFR